MVFERHPRSLTNFPRSCPGTGTIEKLAKEDPNRARSSKMLDAKIASKRAELRKGGKAPKSAGADTATLTVEV